MDSQYLIPCRRVSLLEENRLRLDDLEKTIDTHKVGA